MQRRVYIGFTDWCGDKHESVQGQFETDIGPEPDFVWASYGIESYSGSADVVFMRDGKWFHVSAGHCSCYGLEGQWDVDAFEPVSHLQGVKVGKRIVHISEDSDTPESTNEKFDAWLAEAVASPMESHLHSSHGGAAQTDTDSGSQPEGARPLR